MAPVPTKLLHIDEAVLVTISNTPVFMKEFAFLKGLKQLAVKKAGGCGRCNRSAGRRVALINGAKQTIVMMGNEKKLRFKKLLNAEKVRVRVANGGKVTEHTF